MPNKIHFVGIGGIGMSGLAEFLHREGHDITGSDLKNSENTKRLENIGIKIYYKHDITNLSNPEMVVYSSAIPDNNPEINVDNVPVIKRAKLLNRVMQQRKYQITISGMHGKTTTASLLTHIFTKAGYDPSALLGGVLQGTGSNIRYGQGDYCIVEADEYDRSFLELYPTHTIITNVEAEHMDIYDSLDDIKQSFLKFAQRVPDQKDIIACLDDNNLSDILHQISNVSSYGIEQNADYRARNCKLETDKSIFQLVINDKNMGEIEIGLQGKHNILNALACIGMADRCGIKLQQISKALASYSGSRRRMEIRYQDNNYTLIDDYAHHPTEIKATLQAIRESRNNPIIAIFQPHLYSRTKEFYREFAQALKLADKVFVSEIYPAREEPIPGITSRLITEQDSQLKYCQKEKIVDIILDIIEPGSIVITLGAGDINTIHSELIKKIQNNKT
ncbi:MAG: UDP-N-acetylmuramate--L-alanine ligase [Candidatus Marinimicrobia bacterium]|nr:UDP-N-acetylmuramate--L-alanine ligase [Candidatus Neomarinimicrobiota bacterium]